MLTTGHAQIDGEHARMLAMRERFEAAQAAQDHPAATRILQDGMLICLEHWRHEEELLAQTGWSRPIIDCHQADHTRIDALLIQALIDLHAGRTIRADTITQFTDEVTNHIATFDLPMVEAIRQRQTGRIQRRP